MPIGIYVGMREKAHPADAASVCCLACRRVYEKPVLGGTARRNPGCPACGYVGWLALHGGSWLRRYGVRTA